MAVSECSNVTKGKEMEGCHPLNLESCHILLPLCQIIESASKFEIALVCLDSSQTYEGL